MKGKGCKKNQTPEKKGSILTHFKLQTEDLSAPHSKSQTKDAAKLRTKAAKSTGEKTQTEGTSAPHSKLKTDAQLNLQTKAVLHSKSQTKDNIKLQSKATNLDQRGWILYRITLNKITIKQNWHPANPLETKRTTLTQ